MILGLDMATKKTGYSLLDIKANLYDYGVIRTTEEEPRERIKEVYDAIEKIIKDNDIGCVVFEDVPVTNHNNLKTGKDLCILQGAILSLCFKHNIPYKFYDGSAVFNEMDIYLFGRGDDPTKVQVMSMIPNDYGNNSIVISQGVPSHKTNIANYGIQNAKFYYDRVYYQDENGELLTTIPTYNGNGTEWVKISGGEG